jgi:Ni2+-binding GTPase involved in maturation of urease and hydrogenase
VNPDLKFFTTSALAGEGLEDWYGFLRSQVRRLAGAAPGS